MPEHTLTKDPRGNSDIITTKSQSDTADDFNKFLPKVIAANSYLRSAQRIKDLGDPIRLNFIEKANSKLQGLFDPDTAGKFINLFFHGQEEDKLITEKSGDIYNAIE